MFQKILGFRYVLIIAVFFLLISSFVFIIAGAVHSFEGIIEFIQVGFVPNENARPGIKLLEGLDAFMVALIFMIFGMGIARLFLFDKDKDLNVPSWLHIHDLKGLKVLLWETILVTLVILSINPIIKKEMVSWEILIYPAFILILSLALFLMKGKEK
ncbi:MAG: YqhA family protein [Bacteroidales bacterium]